MICLQEVSLYCEKAAHLNWNIGELQINAIPCIRIETYVHDAVRQSQTTDNIIFTPLEMLRFIRDKYPEVSLQKEDLVLTGTPGEVAIVTPRALVRLGNLLGFYATSAAGCNSSWPIFPDSRGRSSDLYILIIMAYMIYS